MFCLPAVARGRESSAAGGDRSKTQMPLTSWLAQHAQELSLTMGRRIVSRVGGLIRRTFKSERDLVADRRFFGAVGGVSVRSRKTVEPM